MKAAAHPGLYDPNSSVPALNGTRCAACGSTFFPPLGIGCEVCGAQEAELKPVSLAASGVLHSVATVHIHMGKGIEAPFTVGEIQLDDGPLIRAVLTEQAEVDAIGSRVDGQWVTTSTNEEGNEVVEPHFRPANTTTPGEDK